MILVAALAASIQGIAAPDCVMADFAVLGEPNSQLASSTSKTISSQPNLQLRCLLSLLHPQMFETFLQSVVAIPLEGERCCPMSGQDSLEATVQNSIVL